MRPNTPFVSVLVRVVLALLLAAPATLLAGCSDSTDARPSDPTGVTLDDGAVHGLAVPGGYAFRGLPYAAPPTGDLRWRPAQPPTPWPREDASFEIVKTLATNPQDKSSSA